MFSIEHHKNCNLWDVMLWKSYFQLSMRGNKVVEPIILLNNYWFSVPQCSPQLCQKCNFRVSRCHLFAKEFFFVIFSISFCTIFVAQMSGSSEVALMYGPYWCYFAPLSATYNADVEDPYPSLSDFHDYEPNLEFDDSDLLQQKHPENDDDGKIFYWMEVEMLWYFQSRCLVWLSWVPNLIKRDCVQSLRVPDLDSDFCQEQPPFFQYHQY